MVATTDRDQQLANFRQEYEQAGITGTIAERASACSQLNQKGCDQVAFFPNPAGWHSKNHGKLVEGATADFSGIL